MSNALPQFKVREIRVKLREGRMTQQEIAWELGVSQSTVAKENARLRREAVEVVRAGLEAVPDFFIRDRALLALKFLQ